MAATAAVCSRRSNRSSASTVSSVGNSTTISPGSERICTGKPLSRNTSIIRWFSGRTRASNTATPFSTAASARCASRMVPSPRPWYVSAMAKATSALPSSLSK